MPLFTPNYDFKRITEIKPDFLKSIGIQGLILDVDNTLTTHDNPKPLDSLDIWLALMREHDIKLIIVSNNHDERVKPFARLIGVEFVSDGKKPLSDGFKRAAKKLGVDKKHLAIVGDQIFTDILGGNSWGAVTILVEPILAESTAFFKFKRGLEKPILKMHQKRKLRRKNNG